MSWDDDSAHAQVAMAEELLAGLDALPDGAAAARAAETVETLVGLYGECLARITAHLAEHGSGEVLRALADDELVGHLLLVHDLHPDPVETRVRGALAALPGGPELIGLTGTTVRVQVRGGCGSGATEQAVREAVIARAPEVEHVEVQTTATRPAPTPLIPVDALFRDQTPVGRESG